MIIVIVGLNTDLVDTLTEVLRKRDISVIHVDHHNPILRMIMDGNYPDIILWGGKIKEGNTVNFMNATSNVMKTTTHVAMSGHPVIQTQLLNMGCSYPLAMPIDLDRFGVEIDEIIAHRLKSVA